MVISEHASWIFRAMPYVLFISTLLAGLMMPLVSVSAPLSLFGGALAFVGLLALGRFFLALGGLDPASAFGGMGSSREMTIAAVAEPALMLAIFTVAITAGSTNLSQMLLAAQGPTWKLLNPAHVLAFAALFIVLLAETGRIPVDNPGHAPGADDDSRGDDPRILGPLPGADRMERLGQTARADGAAGEHLLPGRHRDRPEPACRWGCRCSGFVAKLLALAGAVVLVETTNAKLRLFRVPDLLSAAFILATLALLSTFLFQ